MKRLISIFILITAVLALLSGCSASGGETASVQSVSMITGLGSVGVVDRYAGKVVSGETADIKKDQDKSVLEVYVEVGDMVEEGDLLFSYDTEAMQLDLDKLYLEQESYENTIDAAWNEIEELENQKANASSSQQLSYTLQINAREADIREAEYNLALKEREIAAMEEDMENTDIASPLAGRVMAVNDEDSSDTGLGMSESGDAFITVMDVSSYRIEGNINELNLYSLPEGTDVLIRSRMDDSMTWGGVVESIDWENPVTGNTNSMIYMGEEDEMTSSSKYPFYITLDNTEGLVLGQHVYIEPDYGQEAESGLMLPAYYISDPDTSPWVWAADANGTLEKRSVTLGSYDGIMDQYEILSGLTLRDYIAFPDDTLSEGMTVSYIDESSFGENLDGEALPEDEAVADAAGDVVVSEPFMVEAAVPMEVG